jgi:Na+/melibiose symporter-like transporter
VSEAAAPLAGAGGGKAAEASGPAAVGWFAQVTWASGSFATGALFNAMALFALFYMTEFLGIAPALAGTIILVARIYDGIIDPLIGAVSDRTRHRWGPRRIYLLIGSVALGASFIAFFNLSLLEVEGTAAAFLATALLLLYSTAYSIFTIPYLAMPPDIAPDYDARTRLMSFRVFFLLAGVTAGSAGAPALVEAIGTPAEGYRVMGTILGCAATALCLVVFCGRGMATVCRTTGTLRSARCLADAGEPIYRHCAGFQECALPAAHARQIVPARRAFHRSCLHAIFLRLRPWPRYGANRSIFRNF